MIIKALTIENFKCIRKPVRVDELRELFKKTRALPQIQAISDDMIAEEIEKYRAGR